MPETAEVQTPEVTTPAEATPNPTSPFASDSWKDTPPVPAAVEETPPADTPPAPEQPPATPEPPASNEEIFDDKDFLKRNFGIEDADQIKEILARNQEDLFKFENETSEKLYKAWKEGKEDEVYSLLHDKRQLEHAEKLDASNADDAAKIVKLALQYKYKDLSPEEVEYKFKKSFSTPARPVQELDELDEDYSGRLQTWELAKKDAERELIIEAKLVKPDLAKYKNSLNLPDLPEKAVQAAAPSPEELEQAAKAKEAFIKQVEIGLQNAKGFNATYKDEAVEIPVAYDLTPEDKAQIKPLVESLYSSWDYFVKRWVNTDGTYNTGLMAEDLYLLENKGKVLQKLTNEAGAQRMKHEHKVKSNIQITPGSNQPVTVTPNLDDERGKMAAHFFSQR